MGYYVNAPNQDKKDFLDQHCAWSQAVPPCHHDFRHHGSQSERFYCWVCLVDNGHFTAAAVIHNISELKEFANEYDPRPKHWYLISKEVIRPFVDHFDRIPWDAPRRSRTTT